MILVKLMGGLGNQMFQYAAARALALRHNTIVKVDTGYLEDRSPRKGFVFRGYDLDLFTLKVDRAAPREVPTYIDNTVQWPLSSRVRRKLKESVLSKLNKRIILEPHFHFYEGLLSAPDGVYLIGYWQSAKYFQDQERTIRQDFTFAQPISADARELQRAMEKERSVCLNVRRGDLVTDPTLALCPKEYYQRAIAHIGEKIADPHFYVFSDDIEWCRRSLEIPHRTTFVDHSLAGKKFSQYLQLMISCEHFIIPNSTFGWWAAWLNTGGPDKLVIAPKQWFRKNGYSAKDLIPGAWTTL